MGTNQATLPLDNKQIYKKEFQTLKEEIANSISHGLGLIAAIVALPFLVLHAVQNGTTSNVVGAAIFGGTMIFLYLSSTIYHAMPQNRAKKILRFFDHGAIYLFIAGTYTPFTLGVLRGAWGWTLLSLIWACALLGVTLKLMGGIRFPVLSTAIYVVMGWLGIVAIKPMWQAMETPGLLWLVAGGLFYTGGVAFYVAKSLRFSHFIWHLFVIMGSLCHFFAVIWYAY